MESRVPERTAPSPRVPRRCLALLSFASNTAAVEPDFSPAVLEWTALHCTCPVGVSDVGCLRQRESRFYASSRSAASCEMISKKMDVQTAKGSYSPHVWRSLRCHSEGELFWRSTTPLDQVLVYQIWMTHRFSAQKYFCTRPLACLQ